MSASTLAELLPLQRRMLAEIGGERFVGTSLTKAIKASVDNAVTPADALTVVQALHSQFTKFVKALQQLAAQMNNLGIDAYTPPAGEHEIAVIIPDTVTRHEMKEIEEQLHDWRLAIGFIQELVTGRHDPVRVVEVGRGSLVVIVGTCFSAAFATLKIVNMCLDTYERILKIRRLRSEAKELKLAKSVTEPLKQEEQRQTGDAIEKIARDIVTTLGTQVLNGRTDPERLTYSRKVVQFILRQVDQGVEIQVMLPASPEPAEDGAVAAQLPQSDEVLREMKTASQHWLDIPKADQPILQLEAPSLEPSGEVEKSATADGERGEHQPATPVAAG